MKREEEKKKKDRNGYGDTDLRFQLGQPERGVVLVLAAERAACAASGYLALGRVQRIVGVQHADDAAGGAPRARRAAVG